MQYKAVKLVKRPEIHITPDVFELVTLDTPALDDGQFLLKQKLMSLDPAMKGWMSADTSSYIPPVGLGEIMRSSGVAEVVESRNEKFPVGLIRRWRRTTRRSAVSRGRCFTPTPVVGCTAAVALYRTCRWETQLRRVDSAGFCSRLAPTIRAIAPRCRPRPEHCVTAA
jgi:hypothetical protein